MCSYCCASSCAAGEWVSCDQVLLGFELFRGSYQWEDKPNFNINHRSTGNVTVSLGITIKGVGQFYCRYVCLSRCDSVLFTQMYICPPLPNLHLDHPSPSSSYTSRAHFSLPQPLHLRVTLKDQMGQSVSVQFEQVLCIHSSAYNIE